MNIHKAFVVANRCICLL